MILLVAVVVLCLGYLLPQLVRDRRRVVEAAEKDREAWGARVVKTLKPTKPHGRSTRNIISSQVTTGGAAMPQQHGESTPRAITAKPAARPAPSSRSRQVNGARWRASLAVSFTLVSMVGWVLVARGTVLMVAALVPTLGLAGVLVAGRRAAVAQAERRRPRPVGSGREAVRANHPAGRGDVRVSRKPGQVARVAGQSTAQVGRAAGQSAEQVARVAVSAGMRRPAMPQATGDGDATERHRARQAERLAREVTQAGAGVSRVTRVAAQTRALRDTGMVEVDGQVTASIPVLPARRPLTDRPPARLPDPAPITAAEVAAGVSSGAGGPGETAGGDVAARAGVLEAVAKAPADEAESALTQTGEAKPIRDDERAWTPTEVPAPIYTLAAQEKRWEPAPLTEEDFEAAREAAARLAPHTGDTGKIPLPARVVFGESALDVDAALARRRAAR